MKKSHGKRSAPRTIGAGVTHSRHRRQPRQAPATFATAVAIGIAMWSASGVAQADEGEAAIAEIWDQLPPEAQEALQESYGEDIVAEPAEVAAQVEAPAPSSEPALDVQDSEWDARMAERDARRAERSADAQEPEDDGSESEVYALGPEYDWAAEDAEAARQLAEIIAYTDAVAAESWAMHEAAVAADSADIQPAYSDWTPPAAASEPNVAWVVEPVAAPAPVEAPSVVLVAYEEPAHSHGPAYTSSSCCDKAQLVQLATDAGFPDPNLAAAIAMSESGGNPGVPGDQGDSLGLWQINWPAHYDKGFSQEDLLTPEGNAAAAKAVYDEAGGFGPWTDYGNGNYEKYL